jgi:hypothetical protein
VEHNKQESPSKKALPRNVTEEAITLSGMLVKRDDHCVIYRDGTRFHNKNVTLFNLIWLILRIKIQALADKRCRLKMFDSVVGFVLSARKERHAAEYMLKTFLRGKP